MGYHEHSATVYACPHNDCDWHWWVTWHDVTQHALQWDADYTPEPHALARQEFRAHCQAEHPNHRQYPILHLAFYACPGEDSHPTETRCNFYDD